MAHEIVQISSMPVISTDSHCLPVCEQTTLIASALPLLTAGAHHGRLVVSPTVNAAERSFFDTTARKATGQYLSVSVCAGESKYTTPCMRPPSVAPLCKPLHSLSSSGSSSIGEAHSRGRVHTSKIEEQERLQPLRWRSQSSLY